MAYEYAELECEITKVIIHLGISIYGPNGPKWMPFKSGGG